VKAAANIVSNVCRKFIMMCVLYLKPHKGTKKKLFCKAF